MLREPARGFCGGPLAKLCLLLGLGVGPACSGESGGSVGATATEGTGSTSSAGEATETSTGTGTGTGTATATMSGTATGTSSTGTTATSESDATSDATTGGGSTTAESTGVTSTGEPTTTTGTSTTGDPPVCGDGIVDPGESCDDGNGEAGDGCEADCTWTPCAILWSKTYAIDGRRLRGIRLAAIEGGDVIVGINDNPAQLDNRLRLARVDAVGDELWSVLVSDVRSQPFGVAVAENGAVVTTGTDSSNPFSRDLTAGYDGDGGPQWSVMDLYPEASVAHGVAALVGGDVAVVGSRSLAKSAWIARLSSGGAEVWKEVVLPPGYTSLQFYAAAADATSIVAAGICSGDEGAGACVARFTLDGEMVWMNPVVDNGVGVIVQFFDVDIGGAGEVAVTGHVFTANEGDDPGSDFYVALFDNDGGALWADIFDSGPGKTYDRGDGVAIDDNGDVVAVGRVPGQSYAGHLRKYDSDGGLICEETLDLVDMQNTILFDVVIAGDGRPRITGQAGTELYVAAITP